MATNPDDHEISYQQPSPLKELPTFMATTGPSQLVETPEPLAALVARTWRECGAPIPGGFEIGGVKFGVNSGHFVIEACINHGTGHPYAVCALPRQLDSFPGIRSALVGALVSYLRTSSALCMDNADVQHALAIAQEACFGGSHTDDLYALCLAALAVKKAKESSDAPHS